MKRFVLLAVFAALTSMVQAGNWPNWRGPNFNGSADETGLPDKFSTTENVLWAADLPGPAASTPIIWEDSVFLTTTNEKEQKLLGLCLDRKSGAVKWQKEIGKGFRADDRSNFAGPSPVTDGKTVIFFFGTGDLAAYDFAGKEKWKMNVQEKWGKFAFLWTFSTSPQIWKDTVYLQVLQRNVAFEAWGVEKGEKEKPNDSYLLALDVETGKEKWRHTRPADAQEESLEAFTTPIPFSHAGREELIIAGGDCVTGHNPATGEELWRWGTWNPSKISHWRLVPSPVAGDGIVLTCAPKKQPVYAVTAGGKGNLGEKGLAWKSGDTDVNSVSSDVSTPLFYKGRFFIVNSDKESLACVEPKSGKVIWDERLDGKGKIEASPLGADGKIYTVNHRGVVAIVEAGDAFKQIATIPMAEGDQFVRSSMAAAQGCLFIRTNAKLYCISKK